MRQWLTWALVLLLLQSVRAVPGLNTRSQFAEPQRQWALLVGVSKYKYLPEPQWLDGCDSDAKALAEFLLSPRGGAFPPAQVKLLTNESATTQSVRIGLDSLIKKVASGDVVYLFFACHGKVELYGSGEVAYLMTYDANPDHLNATALPMDELRRYIDVNLRQAQVVMISDACHSGNLGSPPPESERRRSSIVDAMLDIGDRNGALNIMACRRDESAVEDPRLGGHGVLTYCLLRALNGDGGSGPDGVVRAQDVLEYIMRQVPRLTDQQQHPRHSSNYHDEFPMARLKLAGPDYQPPPVAFAAGGGSGEGGSPLRSGPSSSLRILGAPAESEIYLVQGNEQRTIGRVLSSANLLVAEGLTPGRYTLVQSLNGKQSQWSIELRPGEQRFNIQAGVLESTH